MKSDERRMGKTRVTITRYEAEGDERNATTREWTDEKGAGPSHMAGKVLAWAAASTLYRPNEGLDGLVDAFVEEAWQHDSCDSVLLTYEALRKAINRIYLKNPYAEDVLEKLQQMLNGTERDDNEER